MSKPATPEDPTVEALQAITLGLGAVLEIEDRIAVHTHAGTKLEGLIEDVNAAAFTIRTDAGELFLVPLSSVDVAQIFEADEEDEGDTAHAVTDGEELPPAARAPESEIA